MLESLRKRLSAVDEVGGAVAIMVETSTLKALLDVVEALERYVRHLDQGRRHIDNDTALDAWDRQVGQNWDLIEDALAALERSDEG